MTRTATAIDILEATYQLDQPRDAWLNNLCQSLQPLTDLGMGVCISEFRVDQNMTPHIVGFNQAGGPFDFSEVAAKMQTVVSREWVESVYLSPGHVGCAFGDNDMAVYQAGAAALEVVSNVGIYNLFGSSISWERGRGLFYCAPMPENKTVPPSLIALWDYLMPHIRSALRLYDRFETSIEEAVLEPGSGKVLHAEGATRSKDVRECLRSHAQAIDKARSRAGRSNPEQALHIWRGLVDGTWSLVDRFDEDGRRFVVARRNAPLTFDPRKLSKREGQVSILASTGASNKHIAYELGLTTSTIATHLHRAMTKLQCRNRVELIALVRRTWRPDFSEAT